AVGLLAGRFAAAERRGEPFSLPPPTTAHGALLGHITGGHIETIDAGRSSFQPMNVNFGLFPPLNEVPAFDRHSKLGRSAAKALARKSALTRRALADLGTWIAGNLPAAAAE
ncbi:MAG TPA: FADH(2)-oxidizing methylenetetrahydrofolate--tRNA-(uracil(54)-C(5))-methyltransferase TrmFO, partial [Pseudolabrys sp.]|nr:FADH(2)-oxidizing methylenetetrahydrofolate--tRNA-(uracil(54)-C(5))-methyltransferase TrmFO [Pseudolabrys sp.]